MAFFLMESADFVSDISTMEKSELLGQLSWFRSWAKPAGFKNLADFLAYVEDKKKKSAEKHASQSLDTNASQELHSKLKAEWDSKEEITTTLGAELKALVDNYQPALGPFSTDSKSEVELKMNELETAEDEARAAKRAYEESEADLDCQFFIDYVQVNDTQMWHEAGEKVNRMIALEAEFERRNQLAKSIAEYDAFVNKKEFTWTPPQLPDFYHVDTFSSSQEHPCQFVPKPSMAKEWYSQNGA